MTTHTLVRSQSRALDIGLCSPRLVPGVKVRGFSAPTKSWGSPAFASSTAFVALSPHLACVLVDSSGRALTHQRLGAAGMSVHAAWNLVAREVAADTLGEGLAEFWVRPSRTLPRGLEVRKGAIDSAAWLAHPLLFTLVHSHFTTVLRPRVGLVYVTQDFRNLTVVDGDADDLARRLPAGQVIRHSVGFPLLVGAQGVVD